MFWPFTMDSQHLHPFWWVDLWHIGLREIYSRDYCGLSSITSIFHDLPWPSVQGDNFGAWWSLILTFSCTQLITFLANAERIFLLAEKVHMQQHLYWASAGHLIWVCNYPTWYHSRSDYSSDWLWVWDGNWRYAYPLHIYCQIFFRCTSKVCIHLHTAVHSWTLLRWIE